MRIDALRCQSYISSPHANSKTLTESGFDLGDSIILIITLFTLLTNLLMYQNELKLIVKQ